MFKDLMKLKIHVAETFRGKYLSQMHTSIVLLLLPALCLAYTWEQVLEYYIVQFCLLGLYQKVGLSSKSCQGETDEAASCPGLFCGRTDWGSERPSNSSKRWSKSKQDWAVGVILVIVKVKTAVNDPIPQVLQLWTMSTRSTLSRIFV